jgi:hypothetical protein
MRQRLAQHAEVSDGVRKLLAAAPASVAAPAAPAPAPAASPSTVPRPEAIRARLAQIPAARELAEAQRLNAAVKMDFSGAARAQGEIQALDREKADLERELATLPAAPTPPAAPPVVAKPAPAGPAATSGGPCPDVVATLDKAVRIRQKELGAKEGQAGAIPLVAIKGANTEQVARELAGQFAAWPQAASQVGLVDQDGDGKLDGFVDVVADGVFRLYRQRPDGTLAVDPFAIGNAAAYGALTRRLDETLARQGGVTLADLVARRPAGDARVIGETADFGKAMSGYLAGEFADTSRRDIAMRSREFANFRGETVRVTEAISPMAGGGLTLRELVVLSPSKDQEIWEERTTQVKPVSIFQTDVESVMSRDTRTPGSPPPGARTTSPPVRFRLDR